MKLQWLPELKKYSMVFRAGSTTADLYSFVGVNSVCAPSSLKLIIRDRLLVSGLRLPSFGSGFDSVQLHCYGTDVDWTTIMDPYQGIPFLGVRPVCKVPTLLKSLSDRSIHSAHFHTTSWHTGSTKTGIEAIFSVPPSLRTRSFGQLEVSLKIYG